MEDKKDFMGQNTKPAISVIIPSLDGYRKGNVPKLLEDLKKQTFKDFEVIVSKGIRPNGRARSEGVKKAKGDIFVFIDDDVVIGDEWLLEHLYQAFKDQRVGLAGPALLNKGNKSFFQKRVADEIQTELPVIDQYHVTNRVGHSCMAIPRKVYEQAGGEPEDLPSGTDPYFRSKVIKSGYKIVQVPHSWVTHLMPETFMDFVRQSFKRGHNSALTGFYFRKENELMIDDVKRMYAKGLSGHLEERHLLKDMLKSIFTLKWLRVALYILYGTGVCWFKLKRMVGKA